MTFPRINHKIIKEVFGESVRVVECLSYPHIKLPEQMKRENKEIINRIEVILNFHLFFNLNPLTKLQAKFQASLKSTTSNTKITTPTTSTLKSAGIKNAPQLSVTHEVIAVSPVYSKPPPPALLPRSNLFTSGRFEEIQKRVQDVLDKFSKLDTVSANIAEIKTSAETTTAKPVLSEILKEKSETKIDESATTSTPFEPAETATASVVTLTTSTTPTAPSNKLLKTNVETGPSKLQQYEMIWMGMIAAYAAASSTGTTTTSATSTSITAAPGTEVGVLNHLLANDNIVLPRNPERSCEDVRRNVYPATTSSNNDYLYREPRIRNKNR